MNFRDIPKCECRYEDKEKNEHNQECLFYKHFLNNYQHKETRPKSTPQHLCCCQGDEFPHKEDQKFVIIYGNTREQKALDEQKLDTPLYQDFNPGELVDRQGKQLRLQNLENGNPLLLLERNVEIFEVSKFLTDRNDKNKILSLLGSHDSGNYEIAVFAAQYCKERNTIHEAIYFDLSRLNLLDMLDRMNILLSLDSKPSSDVKKYIQNIVNKMNEKFENNPQPVTLIFDKINKNENDFNQLLVAVIQMKEDVHRIKIILIESNLESQLNLGIFIPTLTIRDFDFNNVYGSKKIKEILRSVALQNNLYLEQYNEILTQNVYFKLNNNNKIIKFASFIKKEETNAKYIYNPNLLISDALQSVEQPEQINMRQSQSNLSLRMGQSLENNKPLKVKSKRCLACYQKLYQYEDEDDYQGDQDEKEQEGGNSPTQTGGKIQLPPFQLNMSSDNAFIEQYRKQNPFEFSNKNHEEKFKKMNTDNWVCEVDTFDIIDGSYYGEIKKETRIQHGRGMFIEKVKKFDKDNNQVVIVQSVYEGWRIRNKREIYGRLIDKNGLIYEGQFKNNMPHGKGTVKQSDLLQGIYPRGFEFKGYFQNGMREELGIMRIPSEQMKFQIYYGNFNNNMMDGVFTVINEDGDHQLESYDLDKNVNLFRKFTAYVFTDKLYGFVPVTQDHDKPNNIMPKEAFKSVSRLMNQPDVQFLMMDIEQKSNEMLLEFQFATLWLRYQAQNKQNSLILELLLGIHPQLEPLFDSYIEDLRKKLQIDKKNMKQAEESLSSYNMVSVQNNQNQIDETLWILKADNKLVLDIIVNTKSKFHELLQQPQKTYNIWIRVIELLITDEYLRQGIIDNLIQRDEEEKKYSSSLAVTTSTDLCQTSSTELIKSKKQELPDILKAREMVCSLKEAENMSSPIKEFINLARLVEEQDVANEKIYQVKTKQDVVYSLLNEQKHPYLLKYRVILGRAFLEMCVSMHFVNNPAKNCIDDFMNQNVLELFKQSGYYEIAISQQNLKEHNAIEFQIQADDDQNIKDLLDFKNLKNSIKEGDQELLDFISSQISCENKQDTIIDKAVEILDRRIQFKQHIESDQQEQQHKPVGVEIFYNFLGAIAQLIIPEKGVKFVLDLLQKSKIFKTSKECKKKMQRVYKFRKMLELEKFIGTQFKERSILVQSLTHESYTQLSMKQQSLEIFGRLALKFIVLREVLLKCDDLNIVENLFNSEEFFKPIVPKKISVLATLLGLHSKLIYQKGQFNSNHDYFQDIISIFQMDNQADSMNSEYNSMIDASLNKLKTFQLIEKNAQEGQQLYAPHMNTTLFAFIGAMNLDSNFSNTTYKSLLTLLPFIFQDTEYSPLLKKECLKVLEEKKTADREENFIRFPDLFKVSKEAFKVKTFSMNDCFDFPGKLFNIHEFDIRNEESYKRLVDYITDLENRTKHKLVNIIFTEDNFANSNQYIETSYYIVHTHVVSVCLRKEKEMGRPGLVKDFLTRMRNQAKQRVINEEQMLMRSKDHNNGLTLAQKIKILINLNSVQYQKTADDAEKLYDPPTEEDAMNYVNKLNVKKEKTFDSIIYTYEFKESVQGVQIVNPLKPEGLPDLHFIKQPLLQQHEGEGGTHEIIQKNKKYIYNNILENQLIQLSHFLSNQESAKQNELIILDEEQLRVVDYMALRQESLKIDKLQSPIELLSICFQIIALATQSLHEFDVYHGNIKPDRIKLSPSGYDGFLYNGNFVILQPDHVVMKAITDTSIDEDAKLKLVNQIELYIVDKLSIGFCTQFMTESLNKKQLAKCELYREEAYQMMNTMQLLIRTQKKIAIPTPEQSRAKEVLEKIRKVIAEYITAIGKNLEMKTIFEVQQKLAEDLSIAEESISLFRACLKPTFSRNLWIYLDQMSPLHPKLQQLVFPWKQFKNNPIDLIQMMHQNGKELDDTKIQTSPGALLSPESEQTISKLRKLHLGFIEDWWFEIASVMDESQESYDRIDSNELEYVKSMIQSGSIRVKLEWLRVKILIIKYFKAVAQNEYQLQMTLSKQSSTEGTKDQEESKQATVEPEILKNNIYNKVRSISEVDKKKDRILVKTLSRSSSTSSLNTVDDEVQEQEQLRHFVKAAIYPLKDVHIKIFKMYGSDCLKEYIMIIIEALEWIQNESFYEKMLDAFLAIRDQSQVIKGLLSESQLPQTQVQNE